MTTFLVKFIKFAMVRNRVDTMNYTKQIANHIRQVHFGGNWTASNLKDQLADLTWQDAITKVYDFNTIATLVFHINYYISGLLTVLEGGDLEIRDKYSFEHPPIQSEQDWQELLHKVFKQAEVFASLIEQLPDNKLWEDFTQEKYGNYYRNFQGIIEHTHYHLGQIVLIKKIIQNER